MSKPSFAFLILLPDSQYVVLVLFLPSQHLKWRCTRGQSSPLVEAAENRLMIPLPQCSVSPDGWLFQSPVKPEVLGSISSKGSPRVLVITPALFWPVIRDHLYQELTSLYSHLSQTSTHLLNPCVQPGNSITACCYWLLHMWNVCIWSCDVHYPWDFALEVGGLK